MEGPSCSSRSAGDCPCSECAEKLAAEAEKMDTRKDWAYSAAKTPFDPRLKHFDEDTWKCNLFVSDMIFQAGYLPPANDPRWWTSMRWPLSASQWRDEDIPGWRKETKICRGDVVSTGVHMGIAIIETMYVPAAIDAVVMAAGTNNVSSSPAHKLSTGVTIQRMDCP